jgi:hypothetical protein
MLSTTVPRPPRRTPYVLTSLFRIRISNHAFRWRRSAYSATALNAAAGPARAFLDERPHQGPVPNVQFNELLRQLAILYLREPNLRIAEIRMEIGPGQVHGVRVHIALDLLCMTGASDRSEMLFRCMHLSSAFIHAFLVYGRCSWPAFTTLSLGLPYATTIYISAATHTIPRYPSILLHTK